MKVVIELIGNESKQDLLATSNYLRDLAEGSLPVSTEAKVHDPNYEAKVYNPNAKTDLDKLADAVVEATKAKREEACLPLLMEAERAKTRASRAKKVEATAPVEVEEVAAPIEEPAPVEEAPAPAPVGEAPKAPAAPVEKPAKDETEHTVDECKQWAMKALNAKKRPLVQEAFEQVGATSFPTLKESMFAEFIEYISTRL